MKVINDTDNDVYRFRMHFRKGYIVDVPEDIGPDKLEWIVRNFEVVSETVPPPVESVTVTEPQPVAFATTDDDSLDDGIIDVDSEPKLRVRRKRRAYKTRDRSEG